MSKLWMIVPAVAFVGLLGVAVLNQEDPPKPGDRAPDFSAPYLSEAGSLSLADLEGKPAVLNFWASWCAPCEDEAPMFKRANEKYGDEITFVGIDIKDARSDAVAFVDEYGLDYLQVRDEDQKIYNDFGLTGQPETFFLDENGVIVEHVNGPVFEDSMNEVLELLAARSG